MKNSISLSIGIFAVALLGVFGYVLITQSTDANKNTNEFHVVTTFYPVAYLVDQIAGSSVHHDVLVGAGVEPHDYESTVQDAAQLSNADLVVYNGLGVDDWVVDAARSVQTQAQIVALSKNVDAWVLHAQEDGEDSHESLDPHTWLNPRIYAEQARRVADVLIRAQPQYAEVYEKNYAQFTHELALLDADFESGIGKEAHCDLDVFVTAHDAFQYLASAYTLTTLPIAGISPDQEPSAASVADIIRIVTERNIPAVFFETLVSPAIAETIARESGARTLTLETIEGLSDDAVQSGENYLTLMRRNLNNLKTALKCL